MQLITVDSSEDTEEELLNWCKVQNVWYAMIVSFTDILVTSNLIVLMDCTDVNDIAYFLSFVASCLGANPAIQTVAGHYKCRFHRRHAQSLSCSVFSSSGHFHLLSTNVKLKM